MHGLAIPVPRMQEKAPRRGTEPPANGPESATERGSASPRQPFREATAPPSSPLQPHESERPNEAAPGFLAFLMQENCEPTPAVCPPTQGPISPYLVTAAVPRVLPLCTSSPLRPALPSASPCPLWPHLRRGRENSGEHTAWSPPPRAQPGGPAPAAGRNPRPASVRPLDGARARHLSVRWAGGATEGRPGQSEGRCVPRHPTRGRRQTHVSS